MNRDRPEWSHSHSSHLATQYFKVHDHKPWILSFHGFVRNDHAGPSLHQFHCFGEDFAHWLIANIHNPALTLSTPTQEYFGWVILVTYHEQLFTLSIAIMDDSPGMVPAEWRVDISFEKALNGLRAWFRKAPQDSLDALADIIETTLRSEPRFKSVTRI